MELILSRKDLCILMNVLGAKTLIGIANPFTQHTNEEMELEWEMTFKKLNSMGLVDLIDEELKFDEPFIQSMWVLARTNVVVETLTDDEQSLFYFSDHSVIQCLQVNDDDYKVYIHHTPDWTWNHVIIPKMLMGIENIPVRFTRSLLVDPQDYNIYCENLRVHNQEELAELNNLDHDHLMLKQFNRSLQRKIYNSRLMMFYRNNNQWNVEGIHVLSSPSFNWTLKMINRNGQELLEAKQSGGANLMNEILDVIKRAKVEQTA
ncbi:hypothetical protein [Cytobacillus purgationiresistens]|uniref:Uncharacterized protein n=1 Tax=Cytobacillus purgationiresistens TaxID=863449 RepID=A0ABU0AQ27_9BACI|nr:hypothetical protein [Cytobacillus purgationiresistens]MDQ0273325.1 hypothetical protein [Cytobacillus purgationiresistens]